jgi:hypothetical protein
MAKQSAKVPRGGKVKQPSAERNRDYVRPNDTNGNSTTRSSER